VDYLLEVLRILDGGMKGDRIKVVAYAEQLARKLQHAGDTTAAERLQRTLDQIKTSEVTLGGVAAASRIPVDGESRLSLADEEQLLPDDVPLVLEPSAETLVNEFLGYVKAADQLIAQGVGISPSLLIYGPPGCGKTVLARYVAAQLGLPLITTRSDSLISSFLGSTAKNLRVLFEHVMRRPCVLFLDELDALAKLRDDQHELGELKRVVVSLLQNIDALGSNTVFVGATNHEHLLDPAIWRRFAYKLRLPMPSEGARLRLFRLFLSRYATEAHMPVFAAISEGLTGADIRQICENGIREAILAKREIVSPVNLLRRVVHLRLGGNCDFGRVESQHILSVHALAPAHFTCKQLAGLFNTSETTIWRRLHAGGIRYARKRAKAAD
jgi:hypothetical protein